MYSKAETYVLSRHLNHQLIAHKIQDIEILDDRIFESSHIQTKFIPQLLLNLSVKNFNSYGRLIKMRFSNGFYLIIDCQHNVYLELRASTQQNFDKYARLVLKFKNQNLIIKTKRAHSFVSLLSDDNYKRFIYSFGPDILDKKFNFDIFLDILENKSTALKKFLLKQNYLAGISNPYVDEICYLARVHPLISVRRLAQAEKKRLFRYLGKTIRRSIVHGGMDLPGIKGNFNSFLLSYGKTGRQCSNCGVGKISYKKVKRTSFYYCPVCQKIPQVKFKRERVS